MSLSSPSRARRWPRSSVSASAWAGISPGRRPGSDFNRDFHVSFTRDEISNGQADYNFGATPGAEEMPGISVFYKNAADEVFHTYSTYGRGVEVMMHTYRLLDLTPKGRDENGRGMHW